MKRIVAFILIFCLSACFLSGFAEEVVFSVGSKGDAVYEMKARLAELGYLSPSGVTKKFTNDTVYSVKRFQVCNGLEPTGKMTQAELDLLFSADALPYHEVTPTPEPTPVPTPEPTPIPPVDYPPRDEEGYLLDDSEYIYENDATGNWIYISKDLQVFVTFQSDPAIPLEWFEVEIFCRDGQALTAVETREDRPGMRFSNPVDIARENRFVLGFTDDFYGYRINNNSVVGNIIRNGKIIRARSYSYRQKAAPNLDLMAQFPDGTLKAFGCNEASAQELLDMGAVNTFAFGPVLVRDGEIEPMVFDNIINKYARQALGMIEPNHYFLLSVRGRIKTSEGVGMLWLAEKMREHDVVEAINLDGGNTVALIFCGKFLTRWNTDNSTNVRNVTSLLGFGQTDYISEE